MLTFLCGYIIICLYPQRKGGANLLGITKGTRLTNSPKDRELKFRYDSDTEKKLNIICEITGKTKAQVIRDGIDKQYAEIIKK